MEKLLIKYTKEDRLKFISHLELIRVMERALRRGNIPLKFSEGFNPHPKISFAAPLSVGVSSQGEYMTVELEEKVDIDDFKKRMEESLPKGIRLILVKYVDKNSDSLMSLVSHGSYLIKFNTSTFYGKEEIHKALKDFLERDNIPLEKINNKTKKRKTINIRNMIRELILHDMKDNTVYIKGILAVGSKGNLKPEELIEKFGQLESIDIDNNSLRYHRLELFGNKNELLIPLEKLY